MASRAADRRAQASGNLVGAGHVRTGPCHESGEHMVNKDPDTLGFERWQSRDL